MSLEEEDNEALTRESLATLYEVMENTREQKDLLSNKCQTFFDFLSAQLRTIEEKHITLNKLYSHLSNQLEVQTKAIKEVPKEMPDYTSIEVKAGIYKDSTSKMREVSKMMVEEMSKLKNVVERGLMTLQTTRDENGNEKHPFFENVAEGCSTLFAKTESNFKTRALAAFKDIEQATDTFNDMKTSAGGTGRDNENGSSKPSHNSPSSADNNDKSCNSRSSVRLSVGNRKNMAILDGDNEPDLGSDSDDEEAEAVFNDSGNRTSTSSTKSRRSSRNKTNNRNSMGSSSQPVEVDGDEDEEEMDEPKSSRYFRGISKSSPGPGNGNLLEHLTAIDASSTEKTRESALDGEMDRLMSSNGGVTGTDGFDDGFGNLSASNGCQGREEIDQRATDISVEHDTLEIEGEDGSSIEVQDDAEEATQEQRYGDSTRNFQQHQPEEIESSQETETTTTDRHFASTFPADANSKDDEADAYFNDDIMHGNVNSKNKRGKAIKTDSLNRVGNSSNRRERMPTNIPPEAMEEGDSEVIDSCDDEVNGKENARSGMKRQALPIDMAHTSKQLKEQSKKSKRPRRESESSVEKSTEIVIVDMT